MSIRLNATAAVLALALLGGMAFAAAPGQSAAGPAGMPVEPENAVIAAPATVDAGQTVNVIVNGAPEGSRVELWGPIGEASAATQIGTSSLVGGTARVVAPTISGSYELRYIGPGGATQARQALEVAAVPVALSVLTPIEAGGPMDVTWQGPAAPGDRFEIVTGSGAIVETISVAGNPATANVSQITVPQEPGRYQLRYVTDQGSILRSVGFEVR